MNSNQSLLIMYKKVTFLAFFILAALGLIAQRPTLKLTFTGINNTESMHPDSIRIINRTQGTDTVLYYPDTVLLINYSVGMPDIADEQKSFRVFQNYPNPADRQTTFSVFVPGKDLVNLIISDISGRKVLAMQRVLEIGTHEFRFVPGSGDIYFLTAGWQGRSSTIKIVSNTTVKTWAASLEYLAGNVTSGEIKSTVAVSGFLFSPGDELLCIGYVETLQSGIIAAPTDDRTYTLQFASNIPCPGLPTVDYEGKIYNTVQVFGQCWMKENLDVGQGVPGITVQSDNDIVEKYCYNDDTNNCALYGGLYLWDEIMQYADQSRSRGICPEGWHIPDDEEWKVLEGAVDSQFGIGDGEWDSDGYRGFDAAELLKTTGGWTSNGNGTDLYGFAGLPGGFRYLDGSFSAIREEGNWWNSSVINDNTVWKHSLSFYYTESNRAYSYKVYGMSARCLKDN